MILNYIRWATKSSTSKLKRQSSFSSSARKPWANMERSGQLTLACCAFARKPPSYQRNRSGLWCGFSKASTCTHKTCRSCCVTGPIGKLNSVKTVWLRGSSLFTTSSRSTTPWWRLTCRAASRSSRPVTAKRFFRIAASTACLWAQSYEQCTKGISNGADTMSSLLATSPLTSSGASWIP